MKRLTVLFLLLIASVAGAQTHEHGAAETAAQATTLQPEPAVHVHEAATAAASNEAMNIPADDTPAMQEARHMNMMMHGGALNYLLLGERFEQVDRDGGNTLEWELQGWLGGDYNRFWLKTEGSYDTDADDTGRIELQALYSKAVAPFWDLQAGVRQDSGDGPSRTHAVIGLMGLAPYWFEVDAAAFLSERGDLSARLEAEYELRFTQRLLLQPRLELNYSFADDLAANVGEGISKASFGLRLRYEFRREIAPYLGVEWSQAYGSTARLPGIAEEDVSIVAGVRFWY